MSSRYDQREWAPLERSLSKELRAATAALGEGVMSAIRPTENEYEDASTPTLAEASMSTLQAASIQAPWFPLP